ncbi:hypothetical protein D3C80_1628050 [compost metagenome]
MARQLGRQAVQLLARLGFGQRFDGRGKVGHENRRKAAKAERFLIIQEPPWQKGHDRKVI